ncbi:hypothetical protein CDEST_00030 [Colletotrichum destructivum]|uniref:Uncharacterized protein n=1 Tax=Colletotrichum destructivum TaxID=34406 RepID=A0AAX4HVX3_9PEZI|nr:hypothetical protein CDEST_00030 [Colletotrichum destructivum]
MAPQQNTFAVIPAAPGRVGGAPSKPPMTSKQAQKLYKQANKEPRRSRAEQRKWEKERQEEIRKELEKERAAVKARAARERKKAKEEEARENRRRAGQPIFDCRPSQDTIARFVRGNGTSLKRDSSGEPVLKNQSIPATSPDTKSTSSPSPMAARTPPSVLPPNAMSLEGRKAPAISTTRSPGPSQGSKTSALPPQVPSHLSKQPSFEGMPPPPKLPSRDGPVGLSPDLAPSLFPSKPMPDETSAVSTPMGPPPRPLPKSKPKSKPFMLPRGPVPVHQPPRHKIFKHSPRSEFLCPSSEMPPPQKSPSFRARPQRPSLQMPIPQVPLQAPPPKPLTEKPPPGESVPQMKTPQMLSVQILPSPPRQEPQVPPPSTQAIVQDCFDDFFPTASQLAIELKEDSNSDAQPEKLSNQVQDGLAVQAQANKHQSGVKNVREQVKEKANTAFTKTYTSAGYGVFASNLEPLDSHTRRQPSPALVKVPAKGPGSTKVYQELQDSDHKEQKKELQLQGVGTSSISNQSTTATRAVSSLKTLHIPQFPGRQDRHSKRSILHEISSNRSSIPKPAATPAKPKPPSCFDNVFPLICTQDLVMSSQEVLDIESPAKTMTQSSSGGSASKPSPLTEMDLAAIDWDDDLDDF